MVRGDYVKIIWRNKKRIDIGYIEQTDPLVISYLSNKINKITLMEVGMIEDYPYYAPDIGEFLDLCPIDKTEGESKMQERKVELL